MKGNSASFGKRIEYCVACNVLKQGLDVFIPLTDKGIDLIVRRDDATYLEVQVKGRSKNNKAPELAADFSSISHVPTRDNYFFVFYSETLETFWIMSSEEFRKEASRMKSGKNKGKWWITLNGTSKNRETGEVKPFPKQKFNKYITKDFSRLRM